MEEVLVCDWNMPDNKNMTISGVITKEKAMEIAEELNIEVFGSSNGWLECFKNIHCLSFKTIFREVAAVDGDSIED